MIDEIKVPLLPHIIVPCALAISSPSLEVWVRGDLRQSSFHGLLVTFSPGVEAGIAVINQHLEENYGIIQVSQEPALVDVVVARQVIPWPK